ncbi:MAG: hypothetical protein AAF936_11885 [Pseudomonadota bacterium]
MTISKKVLNGSQATIFAVVACAVIGGDATAQSLKEIRDREANEQALEREAAYTRSVCGHSITATIDWRSAADWPAGVSLAASCDGALGALEAVCRNRAGRAKAQRVTQFVCAGDGGGASLRGGTLRYGASPGENGFLETKALLDSAL